MAYHQAEERYGIVTDGPTAVVRACRLCQWHDVRRKVRGAGRGAGMREGNKQRGRLIQHIKQSHPSEYAAAKASQLNSRGGDHGQAQPAE